MYAISTLYGFAYMHVNLARSGFDMLIFPISLAVAHKQNPLLIGAEWDSDLFTYDKIFSLLNTYYVSSENTNERGSSKSEFNRSNTEAGGRWIDLRISGIPKIAESVIILGINDIEIWNSAEFEMVSVEFDVYDVKEED